MVGNNSCEEPCNKFSNKFQTSWGEDVPIFHCLLGGFSPTHLKEYENIVKLDEFPKVFRLKNVKKCIGNVSNHNLPRCWIPSWYPSQSKSQSSCGNSKSPPTIPVERPPFRETSFRFLVKGSFCAGKKKWPPHFAALIGKFQRPGLWEFFFACRGANQKRQAFLRCSEPWFRPVDR